MNTDKSHLPFLDGIRGIAIIVVFLYHSLSTSYGTDRLPWAGMFPDFDVSRSFLLLYPLTYGGAAVAIFFAVSGFCIHLSYQRNKNLGWSCFFNRRFFRIYPAYLLAILVFFFIWPWGTFKNLDSFYQGAQLGSHILLIHNFDERSIFEINPSFWSIAVEIQLYLIYPLLVFMTLRFGWAKSLVVAGVAEIVIRSVGVVDVIYSLESLPRFISASPFAYWLSWSLGAYLAECFLNGKTSRLFSVRFEIVFIISFMISTFKPTAPFGFLSFAWLTTIAIDRLISGRWPAPKMRGGVMAACWAHLSFLGVVSYSFYLFHQPIIGLTPIMLDTAFPQIIIHPLIKFAICMGWYPVILIFSLMIHRLIEQPSIALGRVMGARRKEANNG